MKDRLELHLRDGTPVIVRPLLEEDRPMVAEAYRQLSPEARYHRFWTRTGELPGDALLDRMIKQGPDHMTWVVIDPTRALPGIGGASWWRGESDPTHAELSASVLDADQGRGIGTLLFAIMWLTAMRVGITHMTGYTLVENRNAARWLRNCGGAGEWDGYKLAYLWDLRDLDCLPETDTAADLACWLAELSGRLL